jgi:hypothetical protein
MKDSTVIFQYYPSDDESILVTLTARSGDPDLYISTGNRIPSCVIGNWGISTCSNYTWSSRAYSTDQIFLSVDEPCTAMLSSTVVASSCNPDTSYVPSSSVPVNIVVQGFRDSQFTMQVSPSGGLRHLLSGQPQLSLATPGIICKDRSANGACTKSGSSTDKMVLLSTFAFQVSSPSSSVSVSGEIPTSVGDVLVSVTPKCANASSTTCLPGCECNPLKVFATSCASSKCTLQHRHPSYLSDKLSARLDAVDSEIGSTLIMPTSGDGNCDPLEVGEGCMYFIAVIADYNSEQASNPSSSHDRNSNFLNQAQAAFTISARTPFDIALIPCSSVHSYTDGIRQDTLDYIRGGAEDSRNYEICSTADSTTEDDSIVTLEQCTGNTVLYACNDHCTVPLPDEDNWAYYADTTTSCYKRWVTYGSTSYWGKSDCTDSSSALASMSLPPIASNYFLTARGAGKFRFMVESTDKGDSIAPSVVPYRGLGGNDDWDGNVHLFKSKDGMPAVVGNSVKLAWVQAEVVMPGGRTAVTAIYMTYHVYVVDVAALAAAKFAVGDEPVLHTVCGISNLQEISDDKKGDYAGLSKKIVFTTRSGELGSKGMTRKLSNLFPSRTVSIIIVAVCDSACLHAVSKSQGLSNICTKDTDCHPQYLMYPSFEVETDAAIDDSTKDPTLTKDQQSAIMTVIYIAITFVAAVVVVGGLVWMSYARRNPSTNDDTDGIQLQDYSTSAKMEEEGGGGACLDDFTVHGDDDEPTKPAPFKAKLSTLSKSNASSTGYVPPSFGSAESGEKVKKFMGDVGNMGHQMMGAIGSVTTQIGNAAKEAAHATAGGGSKGKKVVNRMSKGKTTYSPLGTNSSHGGTDDNEDEEVTVEL